MENRVRITPEVGKIYEHNSGGTYICLSLENEISVTTSGNTGKSAVLQNTETGWTLLAHGVNKYDNGKIDWDFSTQGRFEELPKEFKFKEGDKVVYTNSEGERKSGTVLHRIKTDDNKLMYNIEGADRNIRESNIAGRAIKAVTVEENDKTAIRGNKKKAQRDNIER